MKLIRCLQMALLHKYSDGALQLNVQIMANASA
jgi:hypothetical protein